MKNRTKREYQHFEVLCQILNTYFPEIMDVDDDLPPALIDVQQAVPSGYVDNTASDPQELRLAKVPITIITGKLCITINFHSSLIRVQVIWELARPPYCTQQRPHDAMSVG